MLKDSEMVLLEGTLAIVIGVFPFQYQVAWRTVKFNNLYVVSEYLCVFCLLGLLISVFSTKVGNIKVMGL